MDSSSRVDYYGIAKIRDSLFHFVFGKAFSAIASLVIVVTIIRELEVVEYAAYATLHALIMFLRLLTSLGANSALLRFLPDLRVIGNNRSAYAFLMAGILLRAGLYVAPVGLLFLIANDELTRVLNLDQWDSILAWYLLVGFFRVTATFTVGALESLLWQKQAQYSVAVSTLLRLAGVTYLVSVGQLNLWNVVLLELITEALSLLLLAISGFSKWRSDPARLDGSLNQLRTDAGRYGRFAFWAYLFNLTTVLHGSAPNRLIVSAFLGTASTALFGVIDRLLQFVRQYEPVKLLLGLIRPVFNANYRSRDDYPAIMSMADGLFRLNLVVLVLPLVPVAVAGEYVFDLLSNGKYADASGLFLGFYVVLMLGSCMLILELLVKALELTKIFVVSNLALSISTVTALPLLPSIGLWALVCANAVGYLVAIGIVVRFLKRRHFPVKIRWGLVSKIVVFAIVAIAIGRILSLTGVHEVLAVLFAYLVFLVLTVSRVPFTPQELSIFRQLLSKRLHSHGQ